MQMIDHLFDFIEKSPSCFHAATNIKKRLEAEGFQLLEEGARWKIERGGRYVVVRNDSSLIGFEIPENPEPGYRIMASHSDSPCFKLKENPEILVDGKYVKLNVEGYGSMICSSWFDRPLSVAGRVVAEVDGKLQSRLVNLDRDLLIIPNLAIHMERTINSGYKYNMQKDMLPLLGGKESAGKLMKLISEAAEISAEQILSSDLFLYQRGRGTVLGGSSEFLTSPKLDDLECAFSSLEGFVSAKEKKHISLLCVFDNEETGSGTKQGAASHFLYDTLQRMNGCLGMDYEEYLMNLAHGFMVSADNAHGLHPNHVDKGDPVNSPVLGGGITIKYNAAQKYCTDGISAAFFKKLCEGAGVNVQHFTNRSDMAGGSTLGNLSNQLVPISSVDVGLPQLAMHSAWEVGAVSDVEDLIKVSELFYREN